MEKQSLKKRLQAFFSKFKRNGGAKRPSVSSVSVDTKKHYDQMLVRSVKGRSVPTFSQLRHANRVFTPVDRTIAVASLVLILGSLGYMASLVYRAHVILLPADGGEYTEAVIGSPRFVNPLFAPLNDADADVSRLLFSGLFQRDLNQKLQPDLATSYDVSEDKKTYVFHLATDRTWHDGKPVTADDVVFTYAAVVDRLVKSPLAPNYAGLRVEKVDEATVRFNLDQPFAPLLDSLTLGILPSHVWSAIAPSAIPFADYNLKRPIGSGPYRLEKFVIDKRGVILEYTLLRNKTYQPVAAHIERIKVKFFPDVESAVQALNGNEVDGIAYVPHEAKSLILAKSAKPLSLDLPQYRAAFFNMQSAAPVNELAVRQALAYATDKQPLVREALQGNGVIVNGPIPPGFLGYNPAANTYYENIEQATSTLEKADWKFAEGATVRSKTVSKKVGTKTVQENVNLSLVITTVDRPDFVKTAELLKEQWMRIGAEVAVKAVSSEEISRDVLRPRAFDILVYDEILGADPDPYAFWHSSQAGETGLNLSKYANRDVDALLEEARSTIDAEARASKYREFQTLLMKDLPAIFLMSPKYTYVSSAKVKGIETTRLIVPSDRFSNIVNWYIKTRRSWN